MKCADLLINCAFWDQIVPLRLLSLFDSWILGSVIEDLNRKRIIEVHLLPSEMSYRHTKIVFTVGPATESEDMLRQVLSAGGNVCRLNMAHATHDWCRELVARLRSISKEMEIPVAVMMDVKGPEVRTGPVSDPIEFQSDDELLICREADEAGLREGNEVPVVSTNYGGLMDDVAVGDRLLIDNGLLQFSIIGKESGYLRCRAENHGTMGSRRHINLPGITTRLPAITQKDREDTEFGIGIGVDFFAMSFVREADDVDLMRRFLTERGSQARIISKIEDHNAIENLENIVKASDGLMVARGDLGIEVPFEQLPIIQRRAVDLCLKIGRPVIIATHLLESMISSPVPTRAEITDVANGVTERADCLMLSGETTVGKFPVRCLEIMDRTIRSIEDYIPNEHNEGLQLKSAKAKLLRSAVVLAEDLGGVGIVVFTRNGYLARVLSLLRPLKSPVYAFTDEESVYRQMSLLWGVCPLFMELSRDSEAVIRNAFRMLCERCGTKDGDQLVVITNVLLEGEVLDTVQLRTVENASK